VRLRIEAIARMIPLRIGMSVDDRGLRTLTIHVLRILLVGVFVLGSSSRSFAEDYVNGLDSKDKSWVVTVTNRTQVKVTRHNRNSTLRKSGDSAEHVQVQANRQGPILRLDHKVPQSYPIEELSASIAVRSNQPGARIAARLVFPNQIDPRFGRTLTAFATGPKYSQTGQWQTLVMPVNEKAIAERIIRLRAELKPEPLNLDGMFLDRVIVLTELSRGVTDIVLDELKWTGYASAGKDAETLEAEIADEARRVQMRLDRLLIDGRPSVLRFTPYHTEDLERLHALGLNVLWIKDWKDQKQIAEIRKHNMWALATPPRGRVSETGRRGTVSLSLRPFDKTTDGILGWYLGTRVPRTARDELQTQTRLVRAADRKQRRPIFADIGSLERPYSRMLDGVGLSRHPLHTEFQISDYRKFLSRKQLLLRPGSFVTTWIQTESTHSLDVESEIDQTSATSSARQETRTTDPIVVEPEQIRQLVWASLISGCRGIGYWKRTPFDADQPGLRERELIMAITNQEIELLEPWLATHRVIDYQRVSIEQPERQDSKKKNSLTTESAARELRQEAKEARMRLMATKKSSVVDTDNHVELAIIDSANGMLVVPMWYQKDSQYVPGRMASRELLITIPGIADTATIWEVSTTHVRSVRKKPVANGVQIRLENFDQIAALVVSTDPNWGNIIRRQVETFKARSAWLWLELAKAKFQRVNDIDQQLQILGVGEADGPYLLDRARTYLQMADESFQRVNKARNDQASATSPGYATAANELDSVRRWSQAAMRAMRILQRLHWENAVEKQSSALSSPYTVCFQSLPDHWRLIERIGRGEFTTRSLLTSGDFESTDTAQMVSAGWKHAQGELEGIRASVNLIPLKGRDSVGLRLIAIPESNKTEVPVTLETAPLVVRTPPIKIFKGQLVHISGQIRVPVRPVGTLEGVTLSENISNTNLRWTATRGWRKFEAIREVKKDMELELVLKLHGLGEAQFDNLKVVAYRQR
jgi:hypothetical protein